MLERIKDMPPGVDALRATGVVSKGDYDRVVGPLLEQAHREGRRLRFLYHFPAEFESFTAGAAWEDAKVGLHYLRLFERCAVITDKEWLRYTCRALAALMPCPIRVFGNSEWEEALGWLSAPVRAPNVTHRLDEDLGVLIIEPHGRLGVEDFDAIAVTVDPWIEAGSELRGVVVHTKEFPGWESIGGFLRHVRFIRDHHRKIRRVALAADGRLAKLVPLLADIFVAAEVRHFGFDEIEWAISWASARGKPDRPADAAGPDRAAGNPPP